MLMQIREPMTYQKIRNLKKQQGIKISDMLVLASTNDPYNMENAAPKRDAEWFANIYAELGLKNIQDMHLRRIHYKIISQENVISTATGKPYENTVKCWQYLTEASKKARWLQLVDPYLFDDRRNGKPQEYDATAREKPEITVYNEWEWGFDLPSMPDFPTYDLNGVQADQRYHVEVWAEKSTMDDILVPLCKATKTNYVTGLGEFSLTACLWLVERVKSIGKPCRVLYLSDFDPAGRSMPVAVARKIEKFVDDYGSTDMDIRLKPIVLTPEQCESYKLPRTPIKEEERRAGKFEARFGEGATELDALEALYPGELRKIVKAEIDAYRDNDLTSKFYDVRSAIQDDLEEIQEGILEDYQHEIEAIRNDFASLRQDYAERFQDIRGRIENVWQGIEDDMVNKMPEIEGYSMPEAAMANEYEDVLFDSNRDYFSQLDHYKKFQGRVEVNP
jgi:hypothetical protein